MLLAGAASTSIHACNPPDTIFLIGGFYKLFGKKFLFDHHDINPELYEAKFQRRDFFYQLMLALERWTFRTADVCVATNESYRADRDRARRHARRRRCSSCAAAPICAACKCCRPTPALKQGRRYLVGYVGVMGRQEGIDGLLAAVQHIVHGMQRHDIHFGLVGGGTELAAMRTLAKELRRREST